MGLSKASLRVSSSYKLPSVRSAASKPVTATAPAKKNPAAADTPKAGKAQAQIAQTKLRTDKVRVSTLRKDFGASHRSNCRRSHLYRNSE
ncbi:hypothetical protein RDI58_004917 [Solanum bulbocastanum]|uniref:Uncharacterized protein n=1 Tax=Solanum bulbocastanum TaxID=147425 RepID=A0AAN8YLX1_SOLBU